MEKNVFQPDILSVDCIGCAISSGRIVPPGGVIKETGNFLLHQDPEVPIEGFLILTAKKHVRSITELSQSARYELMDLMYKAISAIKKLKISEEVTIIQEERSQHLHPWIFPRHTWMEPLFSSGVSNYRDVMAYAKTNNKDAENIQKVMNTVETLKTVIN